MAISKELTLTSQEQVAAANQINVQNAILDADAIETKQAEH